MTADDSNPISTRQPPAEGSDTTLAAVYPSLRHRAVVVTGGASGIGAAIVRGFVRNGAEVAFLDIDGTAGEDLAREVGQEATFVRCDLTDVASLRDAVAEIEAGLGPVRALINNAGNDQRHALDEVTVDQWDASQAVNIRQQFFMAQAVIPGMRTAGGGSIVNLSSTAWMVGVPQLIPYTSAKAAVVGLTNSLGAALGADNIRVNAIAPGAVMTKRQLELWYTPEDKARAIAKQAIHRELLEDDIANVALFLAADDSQMITKQCLTVDGGLR